MCFCKKKKLLLVVGAGASIEFGMPSCNEIDNLFDQWSSNRLEIDGQNKSLYKYIKEQMISYFKTPTNAYIVNKPIKKDTNFEEVLYTIMNLYTMNNTNHTNSISAFYDFKPFQIKDKLSGKTRTVEYSDFENIYLYLVDELLKEFRKRCLKLNQKPHELKCFKKFLSNLQKHFDLGILNFNYDNIFLSQLPNCTTGFNKEGLFEPNTILNNKKWNFIYHIHGSVHFDMKANSNDLHEITFNKDLSSKFQQNSSGRSGKNTQEELFIPTSNIIAGYGKIYQIQREPFFSYFVDFSKKVHEADAILFLGYGFNDYYINDIIKKSSKLNKNRRIVVLDYSDTKSPVDTLFCVRDDIWTRNLFSIVNNGYENQPTRFETVKDLKDNNKFEKYSNSNSSLSIWHGGFLKACEKSSLVIKELCN